MVGGGNRPTGFARRGPLRSLPPLFFSERSPGACQPCDRAGVYPGAEAGKSARRRSAVGSRQRLISSRHVRKTSSPCMAGSSISPGRAGELAQGVDGPAARLVEGVEHLLLRGRHGEDQVGLGEEVPMPLQIGRGEPVLAQVDALLPQHDPRVERGQHAVARVGGDAARADADMPSRVALGQRPLEQHVRHHAACRIGVTDDQDGLHRPARVSAPPSTTARSAARRRDPSIPRPDACRSRGRSSCPGPGEIGSERRGKQLCELGGREALVAVQAAHGLRLGQQRVAVAVDVKHLAVHVGGGVAREIHHQRRDVVRDRARCPSPARSATCPSLRRPSCRAASSRSCASPRWA